MLNKIAGLMIAGVVLLTTGCAGVVFQPKGAMQGFLFAENQSNTYVNDDEQGGFAKKGESCAKSILGWVTIGDASVASAAKNGGITNVGVIDNDFSNILGVYAEFCIVVHGN